MISVAHFSRYNQGGGVDSHFDGVDSDSGVGNFCRLRLRLRDRLRQFLIDCVNKLGRGEGRRPKIRRAGYTGIQHVFAITFYRIQIAQNYL